jgi:LPXTG-motif cell wall-anchored protein
MKRIFMRLVLVLTVLIGLGAGTPALATTVGGTGGNTGTAVTIHANPNAAKLDGSGVGAGADEGSDTIPNGKKPSIKNKTQDDQATATGNKKASPAAAVATVVKAGSADLIAGRLPQTSESRMFLTSIFGLLLLIVLILSVTVYRQARLLRERE